MKTLYSARYDDDEGPDFRVGTFQVEDSEVKGYLGMGIWFRSQKAAVRYAVRELLEAVADAEATLKNYKSELRAARAFAKQNGITVAK